MPPTHPEMTAENCNLVSDLQGTRAESRAESSQHAVVSIRMLILSGQPGRIRGSAGAASDGRSGGKSVLTSRTRRRPPAELSTS